MNEPSEPSVQSEAPWFAFWVREWLTDEQLALWPLERKGALLELRCRAWLSNPACSLPNDDATLAVLSGLGRRWRLHATAIRAVLDEKDGRVYDPYLLRLYETMVAKHRRRVDAGKKGAISRWHTNDKH